MGEIQGGSDLHELSLSKSQYKLMLASIRDRTEKICHLTLDYFSSSDFGMSMSSAITE